MVPTSKQKDTITFDSIKESDTEEDEIEIDTEETYEEEQEPEEFKVLDHVNWDMQNETEEVDTTSETPTLDDLTK